MEQTGRLTLPTDADVVEETLRLKALLGADALRDCDGTEMPDALLQDPAKKYATYYTTRKDNAWAEANPDEIQQEYLISDRHTARSTTLRIHLMDGFHTQQLKVNTLDDPKRWWEVIDRTTGEVVPTDKWSFDEAAGEVEIETIPYHEYTVSFLAFLIWDPVHMYNFLTNDWKDTPHQLTYDVRQPKTQAYVKEKLRRWCEANPHIDVVRFTTFFHQFTLTFDDQKREKFVEWFGYSASVSPYILEKFEKWAGYKFRPEFIVDQGYHNTMFRVPSKEFKDFIEFQQQEVCALAKELVGIVHSYDKEAMMFLGDHWIGTEPYGKYFKSIGLDAVVSSNCKNTELAFDFLKSTFGSSVELYDDLLPNAGAISSYLPAAESDVYNQPSEFYGGQTVYKDIVEFAGQVPAFDCGAYYSDVRSALTDAVTNVVQNNADIDSEMQNAQDTVEFNIAG